MKNIPYLYIVGVSNEDGLSMEILSEEWNPTCL